MFIQLIIIFTTGGLLESVELCNVNNTIDGKPLLLITFGNGTENFSTKTPPDFNFSTNHKPGKPSRIDAGEFGFMNKVPQGNDDWHVGTPDHTENDDGGYMFLIDINENRGAILFQYNVSGLCAGQLYEFSAYLANVKRKDPSALDPNVRFQVQVPVNNNDSLAQKDTSNISQCDQLIWLKHCLSFNASNSTVVLLMTSNVHGGRGNNIAIDDIELRLCPNEGCAPCSADLTADKCVAPTTTTTSTSTTTSTTSTSTITLTTSMSTTTSTTSTSTTTSTASTPMTTSSTSTSITTSTTSTTTSTTLTSTTTSITSTSTAISTTSTTSTTRNVNTDATSLIATVQTENSISYFSFISVVEESPLFIPKSCGDLTSIGLNCNISASPCKIANLCQNDGNCTADNTTSYGYICSCPFGFHGINCELDNRLCKPHICLNHGKCNETSDTTFDCLCDNGWEGMHCESMTNYCSNITCENSAICRPLLLNYKCECLSKNYYGRHCEFSTTKIIIYKIISKSFAYIAIVAMTIVAMFVVIMDILTYCFGIDLTREERERFRREKRGRRWNRLVNRNLIYVNALSEPFEKSKTITVKNRV
ncbi:unnamed protein product [Adineta steineri]|uniref:EGF-like domain-containing protein n=1 Tax=Adineta steineri TaxID=433720 RepID=A0A815V1L8_9BILA|nr:unnamed protein product [Adineta steineri]CAF1528592.1 unnamed protein product [Adineta steineri]